jgi:hypothetical protein
VEDVMENKSGGLDRFPALRSIDCFYRGGHGYTIRSRLCNDIACTETTHCTWGLWSHHYIVHHHDPLITDATIDGAGLPYQSCRDMVASVTLLEPIFVQSDEATSENTG